MAKSRAGAVYPYWGSHPKPWRCAKLSRGPNPAFAPRPPDSFFTGVPPQTPAPLKPFPTLLRKVTGRGGPLMRTSSGNVQAWRCAGKGVAMSQAKRVQPFVKFTCARPSLIIKKLRPLNCAGGSNLCPPATLRKVNSLIFNQLEKPDVAGEFHKTPKFNLSVTLAKARAQECEICSQEGLGRGCRRGIWARER